MNERLTKSERKEEIKEAAKEAFLEKGFSKTTMEDIISRTTLSKGGFYHYYSNTKDIMFDIFIESNNNRINKINDFLEKNKLSIKNLNDPDVMAEAITDKVLDESPYMDLYAMFIAETKYDLQLKITLDKIVDKSREALYDYMSNIMFEKNNGDEYEFFTQLINTFILGTNYLDGEVFRNNRNIVKEMIKTAIECYANK